MKNDIKGNLFKCSCSDQFFVEAIVIEKCIYIQIHI